MGDRTRLGLGEFLTDIRGVITSPRRRMAVIHERGALWGSLVLLMVPNYFAHQFVSGIYFDQDPIPGYSLIMPALAAVVLALSGIFLIHFFARLFQGKGRYLRGQGTYRELLQVFGYTEIPALLAMIAALVLFLLIPDFFSSLYRNFRIVSISIVIALGVTLFVWNIILVVLAMRRTYPMGDAKIVLAFLLGQVLMGLPLAWGSHLLLGPVKVDAALVRPIYRERVARFFAADPSGGEEWTEIKMNIDKIVYRWKSPRRFDFVVFTAAHSESRERRSGGKVTIGTGPAISFESGEQLIGRVVGLPGETVELIKGVLHIDGEPWAEPYITPEFWSEQSIAPKRLTPSQYLVLPEDRRLLDFLGSEIVVNRVRITGRKMINKWPLGWWLHKPAVFLTGHPVSQVP